uniref:Uncharacterized protein n=1 Tax=Fundulus heteroclitus TaxID=8078 RepID=A0A3Q2QR69_FUNHE
VRTLSWGGKDLCRFWTAPFPISFLTDCTIRTALIMATADALQLWLKSPRPTEVFRWRQGLWDNVRKQDILVCFIKPCQNFSAFCPKRQRQRWTSPSPSSGPPPHPADAVWSSPERSTLS